jgi:hypothetical protein
MIEAAEFLDLTKGTLPERIAGVDGVDLEKLNTGLGFLFSYLRGASDIFRRSADGGRHGAIIALDAAWRFIALFEKPYAEILFVPFLHLQDALRMLDEGAVSPMVKPVRRRGRSRSSDVRAALRGRAAGCVAQLAEAQISLENAHALVAEGLVKLGVRRERGVRVKRDSEEITSAEITATTVRHWCEDVAADVGRHGAAAIVYHGMFTDDERQKFSSLPSNQARQAYALNSLAAFVRAHFPSAPKVVSSKP